MTSLQVAAAQLQIRATHSENQAQIQAAAEQARAAGAQLLVLPELHNGPYFCQTQDPQFFNLAETIPGPSTEFLSQLAKQYQLVIVGSLFEKRAAGIYHNTAVVLDTDGTLVGFYRKMHIPLDPEYNEKFYFTPGDTGFFPITTSLGKLGVLVCWDQWFPEAARLMALRGADMLIYPTAIGFKPSDSQAEQQRQVDSWEIIQRAHAIANCVPVISCNRVGHETAATGEGISFWGHSFITGVQGELLTQPQNTAPALITASLDLSAAERQRQAWLFQRDRRVDAYAGLAHLDGKT